MCREALLTRARWAERKGRAGGSSSACWWWLAPTLCALRAKCRPCKPLSSACRCRLKAPPRWFDAARRAASNHVGVARRGRTARPRSGLRRASGSERQKKPDSGHLGLDRAWSADCTVTSDGVVSPHARCDLLSRLRSQVRTQIYALENHYRPGEPLRTRTYSSTVSLQAW